MTSRRERKLEPLKKRGNKVEVWQGVAIQTSGGLKYSDLFNDNGKIKSKKQAESGRIRAKKINECLSGETERKAMTAGAMKTRGRRVLPPIEEKAPAPRVKLETKKREAKKQPSNVLNPAENMTIVELEAKIKELETESEFNRTKSYKMVEANGKATAESTKLLDIAKQKNRERLQFRKQLKKLKKK